MERTFADERVRIHTALQEQKRWIEMNLSVKYTPGRTLMNRIRQRLLIGLCNVIIRASGSDFRVKLIKHEEGGADGC